MTRLVALLLVCAPALASADKAFTEGKGSAWDCTKDPVVIISTNNAAFTLTGACKAIDVAGNHNKVAVASTTELTVTGNENDVAVAAADKISTPGNKNTVKYGKPHGKSTSISNLGNGNTVASDK